MSVYILHSDNGAQCDIKLYVICFA